MGKLFDKIAIIGIGLIGGSLGMAIKKEGLAGEVVGFDINEDSLRIAKELQAIDCYSADDFNGLTNADLVILAAPITTNIKLLKAIKPYLKPGVIVTDVGSTKADFVKNCEATLGNLGYFIGGHPMAGSEVGGVKGADSYLFENALYLLTPTDRTDEKALEKVKLLVKSIGAKLYLINPQKHDLLVATVSHLPHLIASTLVNTVNDIQREHPDALLLAAGGFRDTTRIASGNPELWRDICFNNAEEILRLIKIFKNNLEELEGFLENNQSEYLKDSLLEAKKVRDEIPAKLKGYWPFLEEVIVTIPDKPGTIAQVASILGEKGINIDDIEILRVREGEGGSLRLGFASLGSGVKAVQVLKDFGIVAREK